MRHGRNSTSHWRADLRALTERDVRWRRGGLRGRGPRNRAFVRSRFELTRLARVLPALETKHGYARRARNARCLQRDFISGVCRATPTSATTTSTPSLSACRVGVRDLQCDT